MDSVGCRIKNKTNKQTNDKVHTSDKSTSTCPLLACAHTNTHVSFPHLGQLSELSPHFTFNPSQRHIQKQRRILTNTSSIFPTQTYQFHTTTAILQSQSPVWQYYSFTVYSNVMYSTTCMLCSHAIRDLQCTTYVFQSPPFWRQ